MDDLELAARIADAVAAEAEDRVADGVSGLDEIAEQAAIRTARDIARRIRSESVGRGQTFDAVRDLLQAAARDHELSFREAVVLGRIIASKSEVCTVVVMPAEQKEA